MIQVPEALALGLLAGIPWAIAASIKLCLQPADGKSPAQRRAEREDCRKKGL